MIFLEIMGVLFLFILLQKTLNVISLPRTPFGIFLTISLSLISVVAV